ncbi:MAG: class I SAM-dependent methyltransferase [Deltaproteobacteria bacterium]|nr:class I SAM-dependent methyltransferase [Deltaproteobacteria bacterium]
MTTENYSEKSTVEEIRHRFDADVERFANLETGQSATMDAPLAMELITRAAVAATSPIRRVLDIGCGAGNNTIMLRQRSATPFDCDLVDLSLPMLTRASERIRSNNTGKVRLLQGDFRTIELQSEGYDVILAATVLHHLRDDKDWETAFRKIHTLTAPGGSVWITDLVSHETEAIRQLMWLRYEEYLVELGGTAYRDQVVAYIAREDSPRPVTWQLRLLKRVGFDRVELLHKNACFAAFGAVKYRDTPNRGHR